MLPGGQRKPPILAGKISTLTWPPEQPEPFYFLRVKKKTHNINELIDHYVDILFGLYSIILIDLVNVLRQLIDNFINNFDP